jgi:hypothetical protein
VPVVTVPSAAVVTVPSAAPASSSAAEVTTVAPWRVEPVLTEGATAISGTGEHDVWFVNGDALYHSDGEHTELIETNICNPEQNPMRKMSVDGMYVDDKAIVLYGSIATPYDGDSGSIRALARRSRHQQKWTCQSEGPSFSILRRADCGASFWQVSYDYQGILRSGQKPLALPRSNDFNITAFGRSCSGPVWVAANVAGDESSHEVWEYSHAKWRSLGAPPGFVYEIHGVDSGSIWAIGYRDWSHDGDFDTVMRYEPSTGWRRIEVPVGFDADAIVGINPNLIWFLGKNSATRWSPGGFDLRPLPFKRVHYMNATWVSPEGHLWLSGYSTVGRILD